jgi:hypothetical protein
MKNHTHNFRGKNRGTLIAARLEMVKRFRRSGQTRLAFCESEGVAKSTLDWWLHQSKGLSKKKQLAFQELAVVSSPIGRASNWGQEVISPEGWTIRFEQTLSVDEIVRLLREARC